MRAAAWITTFNRDRLLKREDDLVLSDEPTDGAIEIDPSVTFQSIDGFGASITESSAWLLQHCLNSRERDALLTKLFDREQGIGLSYLRQPIGASDFSLRYAPFSLEHDREDVIPSLREVLRKNPALRVMGSPWSPPARMKTSFSLKRGRLRAVCYADYAKYLCGWIEAYGAEGIPVVALTSQNEPQFEPRKYPGMRMSAGEQAEFIAKYLGPELEGKGVEIFAWDHNWENPGYPIEVLNNPEARRYLAGTAFHGYVGTVAAQSVVHDAHPDKKIVFTECTSGVWESDWSKSFTWDMKNLLIGGLRNWSSVVMKWNIALDERGGPRFLGDSVCRGLVTIDSRTGEVTYNHDYYVMGHFSSFVVPGAVRVASLSPLSIEHVALRNPDGSTVVVIMNEGDERQVAIRIGSDSTTVLMPARCAMTIVLR